MGIDSERYTCVYKSEVLSIMDNALAVIDEKDYPLDPHDTATVARCFLVSIFCLIKGGLGALEQRSLLACATILRSVIEHMVDLKYVVLCNDTSANALLFNNYRLALYWTRDYFEVLTSHVPKMIREYREYARSTLAATVGIQSSVPQLDDHDDTWTTADKKIRDKYQKSWTGLSFWDRIQKIEEMMHAQGMETIDYPIKDIMFFWKTYSQYTHPTTFSVFPHFSPNDRSFHLNYAFTGESLKTMEEGYFQSVSFSIEFLSEVLESHHREKLLETIDLSISQCPNLSAYMSN